MFATYTTTGKLIDRTVIQYFLSQESNVALSPEHFSDLEEKLRSLALRIINCDSSKMAQFPVGDKIMFTL